MTESQEIVSQANVNSMRSQVASMSSGNMGVFSTFKGQDFATKKKVLAAMTDAEPIAGHLGETIKLSNVVAQAVEVANEQTGELNDSVRVILVDDKGKAYVGTSDGLFRSLQNIFGILGEPDSWDESLAVKVVEEKSRKGFRFFTIKLV